MTDLPKLALLPDESAPLGYSLYLWYDADSAWTGWLELRAHASHVDGVPTGLLSAEHEHDLIPLAPVKLRADYSYASVSPFCGKGPCVLRHGHEGECSY